MKSEANQLAEFLRQATPFGSLKPERLLLLAENTTVLVLRKGDYALHEGDPGRSCFLVYQGQVEVLQDKQQRQVAVLGPGALFGEAALLTDSPRNASVRAIEPTKLLKIRREDFLKAIDENRQLGRQMFELLNLRDRPIRKAGIALQATISEDGSQITILSDPTRGAYFRLSPHGMFIWEHLDGRNNLKDLTLFYLEKFGLFSPHSIAETVSGLVAAGFAEGRSRRAAYLVLPRGGQKILAALRTVLEWRIIWRGADPWFGWFHRVVRPLYSRWGQTLVGLLSAIGLMVYLAAGITIFPTPWPSVILFLLFSGLCHELGHGIAVKAFGRKVLGIGIGWNWISPILFVDTSDMWLATRRQRIAVSLAGPYTHLILGGIASFLSLPLLATLSYGLFVLNLLPILNFDGHYIWQELLTKTTSSNSPR